MVPEIHELEGSRGGTRTREATAPIRPELATAIAEHIAYKRTRFPGNRHLFARDERDIPLTRTIINRELKLLVRKLDLQDAEGQPLRATPHMFRHQNATDWLEAGVPLPVIQKLLDHASMTSTQV